MPEPPTQNRPEFCKNLNQVALPCDTGLPRGVSRVPFQRIISRRWPSHVPVAIDHH